LISAAIECVENDQEVAPEETLCSEVLKAIIDKIGAEHFPSPQRFDDAAWIGYRLSEVLPISLDVKQQLLRMTDPQARLAQLGKILSEQSLRA
jgi:Lon protease-like protein